MSETNKSSTKREFSNFATQIEKVATSNRTYNTSRSRSRLRPGAYDNYTVEMIRDIINTGNIAELEQLSIHFYRSNGIYTHMVNYLSNLLLYDSIIVPKKNQSARITNSVIRKKFDSALAFLDGLNVAITFTHVTKLMLIHGIYYGLVRDFGGGSIVLQDLDTRFCRSLYKTDSGIDLLEFDLTYFDSIIDRTLHEGALNSFPTEFRTAYNEYKANKTMRWYEVPEHLGVVFYDIDAVPYLIASLPSCLMYDEAQIDERKRDKQELEKLLIIQMPIRPDGEPVFDLDETVSIHQGVSRMLSNADYVNVLTTFGETKFEDAQDSTQASRDKLMQYKRATYDAIGSSATLFNSDGNTSLEYSVNRDTSVMLQFAKKYARWLTYQINRRYGNAQLEFDVEILPTTVYNREKMANLYVRGAQYGYSKMYAGAALGIKQSNLMGLVEFENDVLSLTEKLIPLQSSHTQSLEKDGKKDVKATDAGDKSSEGDGRPALPQEDRADKTMKNQNAG